MKQTTAGPRAARPVAESPEELTHSLLAAASMLRSRFEEALQSVELSVAKYELLLHLADRGEPLPLNELATGKKCAASNITQLVDRLEADGLVRRIEDPDDRRSKRAALTALGKERQAAGARQIKKVQSEFAAALSEADRRALARGLAAARQPS